jgi:hypothetical protein
MSTLYLFASSLILIVLAGLFLSAQLVQLKRYRALMIAVPVLLLSAASGFVTIKSVLGWPSHELPSSFQLLKYQTNGSIIWVWAIPEGMKAPHNYEVPYDKALHGELEKGENDNKKGSGSVLKRGKSLGGDGSEGMAPFQEHPFNEFGKLPPKDPSLNG